MLSAANANLTVLEVLSITYKVNLVELDAYVFLADGNYCLSYRPNGEESPLIESEWLEILEQKLYAISQGILKNPNAPHLDVFDEVRMTSAEHDRIIRVINEHRPLFNSIGFRTQRGNRKIQLKPVSDLIAKKPTIKEYTACIAAVCTHAVQPYVAFFITTLKVYYSSIMIRFRESKQIYRTQMRLN